MRNLNSILSGRVKSIRRRVVKPSAGTRGGRPAHPGYSALDAKLSRASDKVRGARHGRRTQ